MANYLDIEPLNPVKFIDQQATTPAQFHTKHFDDALFVDQKGKWQGSATYSNPWQTNDAITIQMKANLAPIVVDLLDEYGQSALQVTANAITTSLIGQDYDVYEANIPLNTVPVGCYQLLITCGNPNNEPILAISEPLCVQTEHENTVLIEYTNSSNKDGVIFENQLLFSMRIDARITTMDPGSRDTLYEDQILKETMIRSYPFRVFKFVISYAGGVPDYIIDKLNRIFGCDLVTIDGKQFVKNEGAKWARVGVEHYPMAGWSIELREGGNATGTKRINGGVNPNEALAVVYNIETAGFGPIDNTGTNTLIQLTEIN